MSRPIKLALLLMPLALLLAILADTPYHLLSGATLWGVFRPAVRPPISVDGIWNGEFQTQFAAWLEQQLALKAAMVRTDNTLNLVLFHDISAHTGIPIVLGKHHTLFEMNYINNHNGVSELKGDPPPKTPYTVAESTQLVARTSRALRSLGVDFMVVFYPVKASIWSNRVRPSYVLPGGPERAEAGYQRLLSALRAQGVPVVDGAAEFHSSMLRDPTLPLYNSGGTHWTDAGACEVAKLMLGRLPLVNSRASVLRCRRGPTHTAVDVDTDISVLINVWDNSRFLDQVPSVLPTLSEPLPGGARDTLIVGTSYSDHLSRELHEAGVFRDVYRLTYYRHSDAHKVNWRRVSNRRIVILEQWQWSYFTVNITDFIDDMSAHVPRFADALRTIDAEPGALGP